MSSVINPVGPEEPTVYWRRRILIVLAVVVVLFVAWLIIRPGGDAEPVAAPTQDPSATAQVTGDPSASPSNVDAPACVESDLGIEVKLDSSTYKQGSDVKMQMFIKNNGSSDCSRNLGSKANKFDITSGPAAVWSSANCVAETKDDFKLIPAGRTYVVESTWNQTLNAGGSCSTPFQKAQPGGYNVEAVNLDLTSPEVAFVIS